MIGMEVLRNNEFYASNYSDNSALITEAPTQLQTTNVKKISKLQQQNRREIRMAYLTFVIVTLFFILNMPRLYMTSLNFFNENDF